MRLQKLARLAIKGSLPTTICSLGLVLNMIKRHPKTIELIHRQAKAQETGGDPFDETVSEPMDSHATESSLWELQFLKQYCHSSSLSPVVDITARS